MVEVQGNNDFLRWLASPSDGGEVAAIEITQRSPIPLDSVEGWAEWHDFGRRTQAFLFEGRFSADAEILATDNLDGAGLTAFLPLSGESVVTPVGAPQGAHCSPAALQVMRLQERAARHAYRAGAHAQVVALSLSLAGLEDFFEAAIPDAVLRFALPSAEPGVESLPLNAKLRNVASQIMQADMRGPIRALYIEGKTLEMAALILDGLTRGHAAATEAGRSPRDGILAARDLLMDNLGAPPSLAALAAAAGMAPRSFSRGFVREFGMPVFEYLREQRLLLARDALRQSPVPVKVLAHRLGYAHVNSFVHAFRQRFGTSPGRFGRDRLAG